MFKKVLICTDGSERAIEAARRGAEIAQMSKAQVLLIHVVHLPEMEHPFEGAPGLNHGMLERYVREMHLAVTERTLPAIKDLGLPCTILEKTGNPAEVIAHVADTQEVDLIVLGSRGLGTAQAAQLGSVSYGVAHRAHCPVLLVKS